MSSKLDNIFDDGTCLSAEELKAYADGTLRGADLHRVERHLLTCPICSDALEGFQAAGTGNIESLTAELNDRIDERTGKKKSEPVFRITRMAAAVALLLVAGGALYYISIMTKNEKLYSEYYEPYKSKSDSLAPAANAVESPGNEFTPVQPADKKAKENETFKQPAEASATRESELQKALAAKETKVIISEASQSAADEKTADKTEEAQKKEVLTVTATDQAATKDFYDTQTGDSLVTSYRFTSKNGNAAAATAPAAMEEVAIDARKMKADGSQMSRAPLQDAIRNYEAQKYKESYKGAESFIDKHPRDAEALFYSGVSAMNLGKEKDAAKRLEECLSFDTGQWKEDASWYLALCYVKLNQPAKARPLLVFLSTGRSVHAAEATKMLESLK